VPARRVSRGALGAVVFAGASAVAMLSLPVAGESVGLAAAGPSPPAGAAVRAAGRDPVAAFLSAATETSSTAPRPTPTVDPDAPTPADLDAGVLRRGVADTGDGQFDVDPGGSPARGVGEVHAFRVEVERGLPVDPDRFATFVFATLNDPRGWGHDGTMTFARTAGDAPLVVRLASPGTSAQLCDDDGGGGALSCRNGPQVVLNFRRWVDGTPEYAGDLTGYRQYLVNHEVGHWLGHGHVRCPGPGMPAPVMQQQTLGLEGCLKNAWPYPDGG